MYISKFRILLLLLVLEEGLQENIYQIKKSNKKWKKNDCLRKHQSYKIILENRFKIKKINKNRLRNKKLSNKNMNTNK